MVCRLQVAHQSNSAQVQSLNSTVVYTSYAFHRHNGEIENFEQKKNVNSLEDPCSQEENVQEMLSNKIQQSEHWTIQRAMHPVEGEDQEVIQEEEESHPEGDPPMVIHQAAVNNLRHHLQIKHHLSNQEEPDNPVEIQEHYQVISQHLELDIHLIHGHPLDRSRKSLPQFKLPSNYKSRSILDMQQMLEDWFNKSTFAIVRWRGDAQRYWLDQVLETARVRHDRWLQSSPDQRASLEPAYILGDRRLIPEAVNAVEGVLRTELLEAILKNMADSCMRHGYCTAELIIWHIMKQLILPPDVHEATMQNEILTPPKTLDQASKWLEEMQHRLNSCIKTKQNVHPRTLVAFVIELRVL